MEGGVGRDEFLDKARCVAAADNGGDLGVLAEEFGDDGGGSGVGGIFGLAESAVPEYGLGGLEDFEKVHEAEWADVEFVAASVGIKVGGDLNFGVGGLVAVGSDLTTNKDMVGEGEEALDQGLLVGNLGAADEDDKGMRGAFEGGGEGLDFAFEEQAGDRWE